MTRTKTEPTPLHVAREARRLAQLRRAAPVRELRDAARPDRRGNDGRDDGPREAA